MSNTRRALTPLFLVALLSAAFFFLVGERVFTTATPRVVMAAIAAGALLLFGGLTLRAHRLLKGDERAFSKAHGLTALLLASGGVLYGAHVEYGSGPDGSVIWLVFAMSAIVGGLLVGGAIEILRPDMQAAGFVDAHRIRDAVRIALTLAVCGAGLGLLNYAASEREFKRDFSVGGNHRPSDATQHLIQSAETPVEVVLFFEDNAPALSVVSDYFDGLKSAGTSVRVVDADFEKKLAEDLKVTQNGTVVVRAKPADDKKDARSEKYTLGTKPDAVQRKLAKLDEEMQKRIAKLSGDPVIFYFTEGHGERGTRKARDGQAPQGGVLKSLIESTNGNVKKLGITEGLARDVPDDATAVVVFGPERPFEVAEREALERYLEGGGSLWLLLEPESEHGLTPLLDKMGIELSKRIANDREFFPVARGPAAHVAVFASSYSSHPAVKAHVKARGNAPMRFFDAASVSAKRFEKDDPQKPKGKARIIARTPKSAFVDNDGDHQFNQEVDGARGVKGMVAVYSEKESGGRAVVVGDADVLSDRTTEKINDPNGAFGFLSALWLAHDDDTIQTVTAPKPDAMSNTAEESAAWFYLSSVFLPVLILAWGIGYPAWRNRRRGARS